MLISNVNIGRLFKFQEERKLGIMNSGTIKRKPKGKLKYPFNYYWKSYTEWSCPFCGSHGNIYSTDNLDIIFCDGYGNGGYITSYADEVYAHDRNGQCDPCVDCGFLHRNIVEKEIVYLCENCAHGVNFTKMELITDLFKHDKNVPCKHCEWHEKQLRKGRP